MAQLVVRNIEAAVVEQLKRRAAAHGRSMEVEHREILHAAVRPKGKVRSFKEMLQAMPDGGDDADFERMEDRGSRA